MATTFAAFEVAGTELPQNEPRSSGVAWGAVVGGAVVTAALSFILLALGAGFGLSVISPWANSGVSASSVGYVAIVWLVATEIVAAAVGGYLAGRLRTKWAVLHTDEVYFRDTANGFLSWAVALVISVSLLVSASAWMAGRMETARDRETSVSASAYFVDTLFRSDQIGGNKTQVEQETTRIFDNAIRQTELSPADQLQLSRLVAYGTGLSRAEADTRVQQVIAEAKLTADTARKAAARILLWSFVAFLAGAFAASYAATIGGRERDHVRTAV